MARAQSLRDLASRFEAKKAEEQRAPVAVNLRSTNDKRYSLLVEGSARGAEGSSTELSSAPGTPSVSKEYLVELHRKLGSCLTDLRSENAPRKVATGLASRLAGMSMTASASVGSTAQGSTASQLHHSNLIRLSDVCQQFHDTCAIYAENISPHSKFRYRELLNRMELSIRQLRSCASHSSTPSHSANKSPSHISPASTANNTNGPLDESKILQEAEQTVRQIMQLVNR